MSEDERVVARQIGRKPRGMLRVETRCAYGYPAVVSVAPLAGPAAAPFPTLFWLTCPALVEDVSRVESTGAISTLEAEARSDPALAAAIAADHRRYAEERFSLLDAAGRTAADARGLTPVLRDSGVGGSRDREHLKCLHAHYAFHRARGGAIGEILDRRHGPRECTPDRVRCAEPPQTRRSP